MQECLHRDSYSDVKHYYIPDYVPCLKILDSEIVPDLQQDMLQIHFEPMSSSTALPNCSESPDKSKTAILQICQAQINSKSIYNNDIAMT